jgi:hypothetical protein
MIILSMLLAEVSGQYTFIPIGNAQASDIMSKSHSARHRGYY